MAQQEHNKIDNIERNAHQFEYISCLFLFNALFGVHNCSLLEVSQTRQREKLQHLSSIITIRQ